MSFNYTLNTETIDFAGGNITVRGISIPEITQLVAVHTDAAVTLFDEIQSKAGSGDGVDIGMMIFDVIARFNSAVAHVIALAADEPDRIEDAARLPVDVQLAALETIARLSFAMDGGAKKFWETVLKLALASDGLQQRGSQLLSTFISGSGVSAPN